MNHIRFVHDDTKSWCGVELNHEFYFKTVEQAVLNGLHEDKLDLCDRCRHKVIECLKQKTVFHVEH